MSGTFRPLNEAGMKAAGVEKIFENTAERVFYSHGRPKVAAGNQSPTRNWYVRVPSKDGTCMGSIEFRESVSEEVAKQIALSLAKAE